ncbi:hypothetical protein BSLG_000843 [Batrachochytrium salamandrivorans]|nr:hypothetical protein BSLG_000843 [Batrachochytrium salamandrivorans]
MLLSTTLGIFFLVGRACADISASVDVDEEALPSIPPGFQVPTLEEVTDYAAKGGESFKFETEVNRMMKTIISSLYKNKEVFLRELISNASDALDKIRFFLLTNKEETPTHSDLKITIVVDKKQGTLTITDTGIGMTKETLRENLGTIAKSGTAEFLANLKANSTGNGLIGQFGVGFYSAFLVSDTVTVISKNNKDSQYIWKSTSNNDYSIVKDPRGNTLGRGTQIILQLQEDAFEFLEDDRIRNLIRKHSQFIDFPIYLWSIRTIEEEGSSEDVQEIHEDANDGVMPEEADSKPATTTVSRKVADWELLNEHKPIWTRPASLVSEEEYNEFYKRVFRDTLPPLTYSHFKTEGEVDFKSIIFIPKNPPYKFLQPDEPLGKNIRLFVRRVFITDEISDFLPRWLSFVKAVVDSDEILLNVSRETLSKHGMLKVIRKRVISKTIDLLGRISKDEEVYKTFYKSYRLAIKFGMVESKGYYNKLVKLLRYESTTHELTSLEEYVGRMKKGQPQIYYMTTSDVEVAKKSPFVEKLAARGYEVLFMVDPADEYLAQGDLKKFNDKPLQHIAKSGLKFGDEDETTAANEKLQLKKFKPLMDWLQLKLDTMVEKVRISMQLTTSPCAVLSGEHGLSPSEERLYSAQLGDQDDPFLKFSRAQKRILEINPEHPIIKGMLKKIMDGDKDSISDVPYILFESTAIGSGWEPRDTTKFMTSVEGALRRFVGVDVHAQPNVHIKPAPEQDVTESEQKIIMTDEDEVDTDQPFGEDSFQKRLAKYLLKQTVGRFLSSNVDWDSYDFQLVNGQVTMRDLHMDVQAINKIVGNRLGLQVVSGHIGTLRIVVPWNGFFTEACSMEIEDLTIQLTEIDSTSHSTKAPGSTKGADGNLQDHKQDLSAPEPPTLLSSSFHFADNFIRTELGDDEADSPSMSFTLNEPGSGTGLSDLARMIENIMSKVSLSLCRISCRFVSSSGTAVQLLCGQISLCNHTSSTIQRLIPEWLWIDQGPGFNTVLKYLRILHISVSVDRGGDLGTCPVLSIPEGWLRILFKQDVSAFPASPNISLSPTISSSVWLNSFDIACDIDRIVVVLHPFTIRDVLNLFSNHSHDQMQGCTPSQTFPPQSDEAHTPTIGSPSDSLPQSVEPFMFTLHVEDINVFIYHPNGRTPILQDLEILSKKMPDVPNELVGVDYLFANLHTINLQLQRHQSLAGQAIGIDLTISGLLFRHRLKSLSSEMSTILSTIPLKDVPVRDKMQEFLINKTELPRATVDAQPSSSEFIRLRIESFNGRHTSPTATSSSLDEIPIDGWSHHIAVVLPPMMLYIVTDVLEDIQTYVSSINSLKLPMSSELGSDVSEEQQGGIKPNITVSISCLFVRIVIEICPENKPRRGLVIPVFDIFDIHFGEPHSSIEKEYRPMVLLENVSMELTTKNDSPLRHSSRFDDIVADLHNLYRDNMQSSDEASVKSWSDVGSEHYEDGNSASVSQWGCTKSKNRRNHPLAALTLSVAIIESESVQVHVMDSEFLCIHQLLEQAQALNSSEQGFAPYPSIAFLFMASKGSIKLTACLGLATSRRYDLNLSSLDMILSLNSSSSVKNSLAVELALGGLTFAVQKYSAGTFLHEETIVCNQTYTGDASPIFRVVFSQLDDFEMGLRQASVTALLSNFTIHVPFDYTDLARMATRNLDQFSDQRDTPEPQLDAFLNAHMLLKNYNIVYMTEPFCGSILLSGGKLRISTTLIAESPTTSYELSLFNICMSISHNPNSSAILSHTLTESQTMPGDAWMAYRHYVNSVGFVQIGQADIIRALIRKNDSPIFPTIEIDLAPNHIRIDTFPDSLNSAITCLESLLAVVSGTKEASKTTAKSPLASDIMNSFDTNSSLIDQAALGSVDQSAFQSAPPVPNLVDESMDHNDYDWQMEFNHVLDSQDQPEIVTEAVRTFISPDEFEIDQTYLSRLSVETPQEKQSSTPPASVFVLRDCDVSWRLYEGSHWDYDDDEFQKNYTSFQNTSHLKPGEVPDDNGSVDLSSLTESQSAVDLPLSDEDGFSSSSLYNVDDDVGHKAPIPKRIKDCELEIRLVRIGVSVKIYPDHNRDLRNDIQMTVRDIEMIDYVKTSQWRKFFSYMQPEGNAFPRESGSDMISVSWESIPQSTGEDEIRLKAEILPFRMYIDQDTLNFIIRHCSEISDLRQMQTSLPSIIPSNSESDTLFFQYCEIDAIMMKIDYKPKHVDFLSIKSGKLIEFLNFVHLDGAELSLHRIRLAGVRGWESLWKRIVNIWLPHIRATQVPSMASGVSSVRPFANIGAGVANLVLLPVEQFRKDGRIIKGLQKGAGAFLKAATMETIRMGSRVAAGTQVILERAEEYMGGSDSGSPSGAFGSGGGSNSSRRGGGGGSGGAGTSVFGESRSRSGTEYPHDADRQQFSKFAEQPRDIREGLQMGFASISEGVRSAARTILAVPKDIYDSSDEGRVHPVVRAVPMAILQPMIGATDAVSKTLVGLQNSLDKTQQSRMEDK